LGDDNVVQLNRLRRGPVDRREAAQDRFLAVGGGRVDKVEALSLPNRVGLNEIGRQTPQPWSDRLEMHRCLSRALGHLIGSSRRATSRQ
jgi:hypothetical protein